MASRSVDILLTRMDYDNVVTKLGDPKTRHYPLMGSPTPLALITMVYLAFVTIVGPFMMANRKALSLKKPIFLVNVLQVLVNVWIVWEMGDCGWFGNYTFWCQPMDDTMGPTALRMAWATWVFFAVKICDLLDTVFFVLRKKKKQVSFLHLFHHVTTLWLSWLVAKYAPGGHGTFTEMLNAFIHVLMYVYYLLAAMGPRIQPFLWWKKYLTTLQMTQFVVTWVQNVHALVSGCSYNRFIIKLYTPIIMATFGLFYNFYRKSYTPSRRKHTQEVTEEVKVE